jgi:hypothetical protein
MRRHDLADGVVEIRHTDGVDRWLVAKKTLDASQISLQVTLDASQISPGNPGRIANLSTSNPGRIANLSTSKSRYNKWVVDPVDLFLCLSKFLIYLSKDICNEIEVDVMT